MWNEVYGKEYAVGTNLEANTQIWAQVYCQSQKGILFEPRSAPVNAKVAALVPATMRKPLIWLGIHYSKDKGQFVYVSNNKSIDWSYWKTGQPEGDGRQNCVALQTYDNKWVDVNCNERHVFICERGKTTHASDLPN